jgi:peptidoglycan/xylan/chitin deacetylase (PgdA/CDA1 family)
MFFGRILARFRPKCLASVSRADTPGSLVALTFDDGPHPEFTAKLLKIFQRHHAKATFFMIGENAQAQKQTARNVAEAGHAIANHSWSHPRFTEISGRKRRAQIRDCERAIAPFGQKLFRPPFGLENTLTNFDAALLGYRVIKWDVDPKDWSGRDAKSIAQDTIASIRPGSIVLLHDGAYKDAEWPDRQPTLDAVEMILTALAGKYRFVTVPELLKS